MSKNRLIIDVREPFEYQTGHAKDAINIPPADLMTGADALNDIAKDTELIVYCRSGSRSNVAMQILNQLGFSNVINGINADHVTQNYLT